MRGGGVDGTGDVTELSVAQHSGRFQLDCVTFQNSKAHGDYAENKLEYQTDKSSESYRGFAPFIFPQNTGRLGST